MKIQEVKSPGGITAWLVEEHSVPLIALRFAFEGGNAQDPDGKEGVANFLAGMLDEGAGDLTAKQFQERMEEIAMRMGFDDSRDAFYGSFETLTENRDKAVGAAGAGAQQAALRRRCGRPHSRPAAGRASILRRARSGPGRLRARGRRWRSPVIPTADRPTARRSRCKKITREDLATHAHAHCSPRTPCAWWWWATSTPRRWPACSTQMFGGLPAKAKLTPVAQTMPKPPPRS